jgi:hypothetical protein
MFACWCNVLLGLWLVVAPTILSYTVESARRIDTWTGFAVAFVAVLAAAIPRLRFANTALGLFLALAPLLVGYTDQRVAVGNDIFVGLAIVAFSLIPVGRRHTFDETAEQPRGV